MKTTEKILLVAVILVIPFVYLTYVSGGYFLAFVFGILILFSPFIIRDLRNRKKQ